MTSRRFSIAALGAAMLATLTVAFGADVPSSSGQERALALSRTDASLKWGPCPPIFVVKGCEIAVLQGDPSKPNADVFLRIPGNYVIPPHSHTSAEHMILVSGELDVHYKGQPLAKLKKGDYAYGPPKLPHIGHCRSKEPCTLFISFDLPVDALPYEGKIP